jgi:hypothetical protein
MSDNEDATAALWNSAVLSVKDSVGPPIPEFPQPSKEGTKVPSFARWQYAGDVLPYQPTGPIAVSQGKIREGEVAAGVGESFSQSGNTETLAGSAANKEVEFKVWPFMEFRHIAQVWNVRVVMGEHCGREAFYFRKGDGFPAQGIPGHAGSLDAWTNT